MEIDGTEGIYEKKDGDIQANDEKAEETGNDAVPAGENSQSHTAENAAINESKPDATTEKTWKDPKGEDLTADGDKTEANEAGEPAKVPEEVKESIEDHGASREVENVGDAETNERGDGDQSGKNEEKVEEDDQVAKADKLDMSLDDLIQAERQSGPGGKGRYGRGGGNWNGGGAGDWKDWKSGGGDNKWKTSWHTDGVGGDDSGQKKNDKSSWVADWKSRGDHAPYAGGGGNSWASWGSKPAWGTENKAYNAKSYNKYEKPYDSSYGKSNESKSYESRPYDESYSKTYESSSYDKSYDKSYEKEGYEKGYDKSYEKSSKPTADARRGDGGQGARDALDDTRDRRRAPSSGRGAERYSSRSGGTTTAPAAGRHQAGTEKTSEPCTIIVAGMAGLRVDRRDLERAFGTVGRVESAVVGGQTATITFREPRVAREAVRRFHRGQLNDRTIDVYFEGQEPPRRSPATRGSGGGGGSRREAPQRSRSRSRRARGSGSGGAAAAPTRRAEERRRRSPTPRTRRSQARRARR